MKIILFSRAEIAHTASDIQKLFSLLEHYGFDYAINREFATVAQRLTAVKIAAEKIYDNIAHCPNKEAILVCCGGDGTLLEGIHRIDNREIPVAGVNFGHLGFLTTATREDLEAFFEDIAQGRITTQARTMLSVEGLECDQHELIALNEVAIQRLEAAMLKVKATVNAQTVASYSGDGVIISTPTGSTAYSLSAGGPVVAPNCECLLITPLAPHNFGMRPVVVPDTVQVELEINSRRSKVMISIDHRTYQVGDNQRITIKRSAYNLLLVVPHNISFYETLHSKMMWDANLRD